MSRVVTMATIIFAIGAATTLYQVKYEVRGLEAEARSLVAQVDQERDQIRVLNAEWSYLNRPNRLQDLAERYLSMKPMAESQFGAIAQLPLRPDNAPPVQSPQSPPLANPGSGQAGALVASNGLEPMPVPTLRPRPPAIQPQIQAPAQSQTPAQSSAPAQPQAQADSPYRAAATAAAPAMVPAKPAATQPARRVEGALPSLTPLFVSVEGNR